MKNRMQFTYKGIQNYINVIRNNQDWDFLELVKNCSMEGETVKLQP